MNRSLLVSRNLIGLAAFSLFSVMWLSAAERPRLAVLTDIGGDPDDQQSMVRLMIYANEFEIEALIASAAGTPGELKQAVTRPELIREIIAAYAQVLPNLRKHADDWPEADVLRQRVKSGNPQRGRKHIGEGHDTEGSRFLIERMDAGTPDRPLNIVIWGGQTDLAQALVASEAGSRRRTVSATCPEVPRVRHQRPGRHRRLDAAGVSRHVLRALQSPAGRRQTGGHLPRHVPHRRRVADQP